MADQVTTYQCPACTGPLHFDGKIGKLKCDYCGSTYTTQEIEKLFAAKNESAVQAHMQAQQKAEAEAAAGAQGAAAGGSAASAGTGAAGGGHTAAAGSAGTSAAGSAAAGSASAGASGGTYSGTSGGASAAGTASGWGNDAAKMRAYNCTSCGAELICDETTAATSCPYCGNNTIIPGQFSGTQKPDYVIPFQYEKKDAINALKHYYKGKTLLPGSFNNSNHLEEIKGVYVPFWLFSGHVDASGVYDARQDEVFRQGEFQVTRSRHYEVDREGTISFSRVPVDASTKMPDDLMDSIEPFDYRSITEFSLSYMPGYLANKYDVSQKESARRAEDRARNSARDALDATVRGYTSFNTRRHDETIYNDKTEYAVFPVWLLSTRWQGQNFLFAMNGQTGRMTGNLPVSKAKQTLWFLIVFAACFMLFGSFLLTGEDTTTSSYIIALAFALIPAAIVNAVLVSQMKPVAQESRAAAYVTEGGMHLRSQNDRYIRTTESRVKIQNAQPQGGGAAGGHPGGPMGGPMGHGPHGGPPHGGGRPGRR
ncbi:MAG: hypothetical protein Q4D81_05945 [Eubacteriales bacterium]|nr:hypothetical protein [Eubacteriales bacterium]